MSWWGSNAPQPVTYPELPSPLTKEDFERLADECFEQLMRLESEGVEAGWSSIDFQATNGEEEVKIWDKSLPGTAINCIKTQGVMPCSPADLFQVMCEEDLTKRQEYEKECSCYEVVREITPEISVTRARYKAPFPVTAREIVAFRARRRLPGGGYVSFGKSINYDECVTDSSHIRAALHLVGAICRPVPGEPNRCLLTRIAQLDPKGNIPAMVVNATKKKSGTSIILLRKVIRRRNFPPVEAHDDDDHDDGHAHMPPASTSTSPAVTTPAQPAGSLVPGRAGGDENDDDEESEDDDQLKAKAGSVAPSTSSASSAVQEGKGKERTSAISAVTISSSSSTEEEGDVFFETASALPWDERPFREMYGQHRDEVNHIVESLQQSINRLEQVSLSNAQRLQALEQMCAELVARNRSSPSSSSSSPTSTLALTNLSWGALAFLAVWPVVAYAAYDFVSSRRPPRK